MLILLQKITTTGNQDFFLEISPDMPFFFFKAGSDSFNYAVYVINPKDKPSENKTKADYFSCYNKKIDITKESFEKLQAFVNKSKSPILEIDFYDVKDIPCRIYYHALDSINWESNVFEGKIGLTYNGITFQVSKEHHSVREFYDKISTFKKMSTNLKNMN